MIERTRARKRSCGRPSQSLSSTRNIWKWGARGGPLSGQEDTGRKTDQSINICTNITGLTPSEQISKSGSNTLNPSGAASGGLVRTCSSWSLPEYISNSSWLGLSGPTLKHSVGPGSSNVPPFANVFAIWGQRYNRLSHMKNDILIGFPISSRCQGWTGLTRAELPRRFEPLQAGYRRG